MSNIAADCTVLQPTFNGHVATPQDALILFEACLQGHLSPVQRRPHDTERSTLIRSGSVFVYDEQKSSIKRWTDGVTWSPSRILGKFLVYRELDKPFPPGEKKRALKRPDRRLSRPGEPYPPLGQRRDGYVAPSPISSFGNETQPTDAERQLIGSLVDSYGFKAKGLVKKTMSVTKPGVTLHLVSYYNVEDVIAGNLRTPTQIDIPQYIRPESTATQSFRSPIDDAEDDSELHGQAENRTRLAQRYDYGKSAQIYFHSQSYPSPMVPPPPMAHPDLVPCMAPGHLQMNVEAGQIGQDRSQHGQYDYNAHVRRLPATTTSSLYPPTTLRRPVTTSSPIPGDSRDLMPYRPNSYASIPSTTSSIGMGYEDGKDCLTAATPSFPAARDSTQLGRPQGELAWM